MKNPLCCPATVRASWRGVILFLSLLLVPPLSAQLTTNTWDAGGANASWGTASNWVGDVVPTFNTNAILVFNTNVGTADTLFLAAQRQIRGIVFGANLTGGADNVFDIQTRTTLNGATGANLLFNGGATNASITLDNNTAGLTRVRLGSGGVGAIALQTTTDLLHNSAGTVLQFDANTTGAGSLNKHGVGTVTFTRQNSYNGLNLYGGGAVVWNQATALGTNSVTLGETGSSSNVSLFFGGGLNYTNAITVSSGSGTRLIGNTDVTNQFTGFGFGAVTGNATNSGGINLAAGKEVTFAITNYNATTDRLTVSGAITGTGGVVKTGNGILLLTASNSYSGATDIQGGKLYLGTAGRLGSGAVTISNGANLDFATSSGQTNIVANNISGDGQILQTLAGTDTRLTGDVTSTGGLTINNGTVRIGNGGTTGSYNGGTVVESGAVLAFARSDAYTHAGTISGAGNVTKVNAGDVTLTGSNSYSGATTLFDGSLVAGHASALGIGNITFSLGGGNTGTIRYTAASAGTDWASRLKNSTGTIRLDTDTNTVTLLGIIDSSNTNGLVKSGTGVLGLAGANAYAGTTTVSAGILGIANATALGRTNEGTTVASGAQLRLTNAFGSFTVGDEALTISGTGASTGGALRNDGGDNTWQGNITLAANATIGAASGSSLTINPASGNAITATNFSLTLEGAGTNQVLGAVNLGTGGLTKDGTGIAILGASNTFSGGTILGQGTLRLDHANAAGSGLITQSTNNSTLQINTTGTVANAMSIFNVRTMQTVTLSGNKTLNNATYTVDPGTTTTESGSLSGGGGITKQGTGTLLVTGNNSFTGAVAVNEGVLELASTVGGAAAQTVSVSVATNAILLLSQSEQINDSAAVTLSGGTIQRGSGVSEVFGSLALTTGSFLDFGTGDTGNLTFGTYQNNETPSALLTLNNFLPGNSFTFSSTTFSTNSVGSFFAFGTGYAGSSISNTGSTFTITAIPEPSTYLAAAGLLAVLLWPSRRRLLKDAKSVLGFRRPMRDRLG
jgi:autotransporter-associated beta strand protein